MGWHLERARIGASRAVLLEALVSGVVVASQELVADGTEQDVWFDVTLERSSWLAIRILRSQVNGTRSRSQSSTMAS